MTLDRSFRRGGPNATAGIYVAPGRRNLGDRRRRESKTNAVVRRVLSRPAPFLPGRLGAEPAPSASGRRAVGKLVIQRFLGGGGGGGGGHGVEGEAGVLLLLVHHGGVGGGGGGWNDGIVVVGH